MPIQCCSDEFVGESGAVARVPGMRVMLAATGAIFRQKDRAVIYRLTQCFIII